MKCQRGFHFTQNEKNFPLKHRTSEISVHILQMCEEIYHENRLFASIYYMLNNGKVKVSIC